MSNTTAAPHQTLDQRRAKHAYKVVSEVLGLQEGEKKKFKTHAKKLPARIMTSGLGPALAFLEAKDYARELRGGLSDWISHCHFPWVPASPKSSDDSPDRLRADILNHSSDFLRLATAEALAYLQWLGRFTDALLKDVKTDEGE